jgi:predicted nucleic acid-binding protein
MKGIADTGFVVAFLNRADVHHKWAFGLAEQVSEPLLTCDAVLAEASFHLRNCGLVLDLVEEGLLFPAFNIGENVVQLRELARRYKDRSPDLADLCLIRLSELNPRHSVITVDVEDFKVYRRNRRESIPLLVPQ